jgi:ribosomal protein L37AE/L43A
MLDAVDEFSTIIPDVKKEADLCPECGMPAVRELIGFKVCDNCGEIIGVCSE